MSPRARLIRAVLTVAGWLGPWLIRKLGRLGLARLEAWMEGEIDKHEDKARTARGERRRRWCAWRARLWRRALRRLRAASPDLLGAAADAIDDVLTEAERRAAAAGLDAKPDSYRRWRDRGEPR